MYVCTFSCFHWYYEHGKYSAQNTETAHVGLRTKLLQQHMLNILAGTL